MTSWVSWLTSPSASNLGLQPERQRIFSANNVSVIPRVGSGKEAASLGQRLGKEVTSFGQRLSKEAAGFGQRPGKEAASFGQRLGKDAAGLGPRVSRDEEEVIITPRLTVRDPKDKVIFNCFTSDYLI